MDRFQLGIQRKLVEGIGVRKELPQFYDGEPDPSVSVRGCISLKCK